MSIIYRRSKLRIKIYIYKLNMSIIYKRSKLRIKFLGITFSLNESCKTILRDINIQFENFDSLQ